MGLARFLPAMSGAVPWAASKSATRTTAAGSKARLALAPMPSEPARPQAMSERKSPYSFRTSTIWNFSGAMMTLPSSASNSSTECGTSGNWPATSCVDLLEQAVGRLLDRVLRGSW